MSDILVVDDDEMLRNGLRDALVEEGYKVTTAENGKTALHLLSINHYKLALLDITMPELDGYQVLDRIRIDHPSVRVIMLTGHADLTQAMKSTKMGADDFIGKPFDLEDVLMSVRRSLKI